MKIMKSSYTQSRQMCAIIALFMAIATLQVVGYQPDRQVAYVIPDGDPNLVDQSKPKATVATASNVAKPSVKERALQSAKLAKNKVKRTAQKAKVAAQRAGRKMKVAAKKTPAHVARLMTAILAFEKNVPLTLDSNAPQSSAIDRKRSAKAKPARTSGRPDVPTAALGIRG